MGDTKTDDKNDDKNDKSGGGGGGGVDKDAIREVVSDVLGGLFKSGRADVHDDDGDDDDRGRRRGGRRGTRGGGVDVDDIGRQVEEAVARVAERDKRTKAEQATEDRLKALEERTAKPEKTPREFRKITKIMWGDPDAD